MAHRRERARVQRQKAAPAVARALPAQQHALLRVKHRLFRVVRAADGAAVKQRLVARKRKQLELKRRLDDALRFLQRVERIERVEQQR